VQLLITGGAKDGTDCAITHPQSYAHRGDRNRLDVTIEIDYERRIM
jgi:hypothetical protein